MSLIGLIVLFVVVGVVLWLVNTYIPMAQPIKTLLTVVVVIFLLLVVLNAFGVMGALNVPVRLAR